MSNSSGFGIYISKALDFFCISKLSTYRHNSVILLRMIISSIIRLRIKNRLRALVSGRLIGLENSESRFTFFFNCFMNIIYISEF